MKNKRLIELKKIPLIMSIIFWIIFYILLLKYYNKEANISNFNYKEFYLKYSLYSPIVFWILSLIFFYLLSFIKFILRLNYLWVTILIYILTYSFFLWLGVDLIYFESRIAEFANVIIETFSLPLIISSSIMLLIIILLSLKKIKLKQ